MYARGARPSPYDSRDHQLKGVLSPQDFPSRFLLPMRIVPVLDQGRRSSCVSHAAASIQMFHDIKESRKPITLSREYLYDLCKQRDGDPHEEGTYPRVAMQVLLEKGVPLELYRNYSAQDPEDMLSYVPGPVVDQDAQGHTISRYARITDLNSLKASLMANGPALIAIPVDEGFEQTGADGIVHPGGKQLGGHALTCYGWTTHNGVERLCIRNSWSVSWSKEGNCELPITWPELLSDCWTSIDATVLQPKVSIHTPWAYHLHILTTRLGSLFNDFF